MNKKLFANKRLVGVILAIAVVAGVVFGIDSLMPKKEVGAKSITVVVVDAMEEKGLFRETLHTDTETLYELLVEKEELKAVFDDLVSGHFLTGLMDVAMTDVNAGPWWLYESSNNESCVSAGFCPGVDELVIQDKNEFTFKFTNSFE